MTIDFATGAGVTQRRVIEPLGQPRALCCQIQCFPHSWPTRLRRCCPCVNSGTLARLAVAYHNWVHRMKIAIAILLALSAAIICDATTLFPPIKEAEACAWADLVGDAKVLAIAPLLENGVTQQWASAVSIEILTKGVSAKTRATVLWNQGLADATLAHKRAPDLGQKYRVYLRLRWADNNSDFEPVHPDWGFVECKNTSSQTKTTFIEHTVQRGDTLWGIAAHYYGTGARWRVLRAANFTNDAALGVYPLKSGMRLRIPAFPLKSTQDGAANASQPILAETNSTPSAAGSRR
jgi:hypothetical protein